MFELFVKGICILEPEEKNFHLVWIIFLSSCKVYYIPYLKSVVRKLTKNDRMPSFVSGLRVEKTLKMFAARRLYMLYCKSLLRKVIFATQNFGTV